MSIRKQKKIYPKLNKEVSEIESPRTATFANIGRACPLDFDSNIDDGEVEQSGLTVNSYSLSVIIYRSCATNVGSAECIHDFGSHTSSKQNFYKTVEERIICEEVFKTWNTRKRRTIWRVAFGRYPRALWCVTPSCITLCSIIDCITVWLNYSHFSNRTALTDMKLFLKEIRNIRYDQRQLIVIVNEMRTLWTLQQQKRCLWVCLSKGSTYYNFCSRLKNSS